MTTTGNKSVDTAYANAERKHAPSVSYPELGLKILIVGNCFLGGAIELFARAGCTRAERIEDAELIVFLGGEDVDPSLYGERPLNCTYFNTKRDAVEIDVFTKALSLGIPMFGICRGMQFLHVMDGGKLWQDVRNHTSTHNIIDNDGNIIRASSMHHQMCIENDTCFPLAYAEEKGHGHTYKAASKTLMSPDELDLEAAVYPNIKAIAVQGHPEVGGYPEYSSWCLTQIKDFLEEDRLMGDNSKTYTVTEAGKDYINPDIPFLNKGATS